MPKKGPPQIEFTDFISESKTDFEEGFTWVLTHHITNGHIALMGHKGKGWAIYCYFRGLYSKQRKWVEMPTWKKIGTALGINQQKVKTIAFQLEEKGFVRFRKSETRGGNEKVVGFQVIDSLFYQAPDGENRVEAVSQVFEPELLSPTMKGLGHLKKTGDHSQIPNSYIDTAPPINVHITINNNIIKQGDNSTANIFDMKQTGGTVNPAAAKEMQEFLATSEVKDAIGMTLQEALERYHQDKQTKELKGKEPK